MIQALLWCSNFFQIDVKTCTSAPFKLCSSCDNTKFFISNGGPWPSGDSKMFGCPRAVIMGLVNESVSMDQNHLMGLYGISIVLLICVLQ
jgi:hypothetical protein